MLVSNTLLWSSKILLNFWSQQVTFMKAVIDILLRLSRNLVSIFYWKLEKSIFSLKYLLPSCQLNTAVSALSQDIKWVIENRDIFHEFFVYNSFESWPIDFFIVFKNSKLKSFFNDSVSDSMSPEILKETSSDSLQSGCTIKNINLSSDFCKFRIFFSEPLKRVLFDLDFVNGFAIDVNHSDLYKAINDSIEISLSNGIVSAKIADFNIFLFIFFDNLLWNRIICQHSVINIIGVKSFLYQRIFFLLFFNYLYNVLL